MDFIADLHIHSRFSRATAKTLDLEHVYIAAQQKGITVVGTGDFTHPGWFSEIKEKLVPAETGLFKLKDDIAEQCDKRVFPSCRGPVRFILESEISNIYKKNGETRKNHNLVFMPDLDNADRFISKLDKIGNIKSDGRPILGLDAKHLLDIVLDISSQAFLVPAHIWTPWFSLLGSKSGFNSIEECFEDLTPHIFAVETGLSSDPAMNWRVSMLDGLTLVSNSDAHSPSKLGREANLFTTDLEYSAIKSAIESGNPQHFKGTYEFYPEEGKYHLDGHRKCGVRFSPEESTKNNGKCPVCGKPLTLGVLYRVEELADRPYKEKPKKHHPYERMIPLTDILSEILKVGPQSKKVKKNYNTALETLGPEFDILQKCSIDDIHRAGIPLLGEAIEKMRQDRIGLFPGYDGEFGKIKIFSEEERQKIEGQRLLFVIPEAQPAKRVKETGAKVAKSRQRSNNTPKKKEKSGILRNRLNSRQTRAVQHKGTPLLIVAGPGTGKTLTLTHKIAHLIQERRVHPNNILAVTFTNKAAQEMRERLRLLLGQTAPPPQVGTFHSLCLRILNDFYQNTRCIVMDENDAAYNLKGIVKQEKKTAGASFPTLQNFMNMIVSAKQQILSPDDNLEEISAKGHCDATLLSKVYRAYQDQLSMQGAFDFEDLIFKVNNLFETNKSLCLEFQDRFKYIFVDEYQDLNQGQYLLVKALAPVDKELCVIGDPDQSIYGFRGSDVRFFNQFIEDYPDAEVIHLTRNYRSTETILEASHQVISDQHVSVSGSRVYSELDGEKTITILELESEKAEAVAVGKVIEKMVGGVGLYSIDFGKVDGSGIADDRGFSDFAVLYRTGAQGQVFTEMFEKAGIPCQVVSRENHYSKKGIQEHLSLLKILCGYGTVTDLERVIRIRGKGIKNKTIGIFKQVCFEKNISLNDILFKERPLTIHEISRAEQQKLDGVMKDLASLENKVKPLNLDQKLIYIKENVKNIDKLITKDPKTEDIFSRLINISAEYDNRPVEFFEMISLQEETDAYEFQDEKVALMTMHAAKGLEFPVVFIVGCEDEFIPYKRSETDAQDIDEENRLFYVAMTRAKENLYLTYVKKRKIYGKVVERRLSPFVKYIEEGLRSHEKPRAKSKKQQKKEKHVQLNLF